MRTIAFMNQKGGVGKTTTSTHYAHHKYQDNKKVLFVDSDGQGNSTRFLSKYKSKLATAKDFFTKVITDIEDDNFVCLSSNSEIFGIDKITGQTLINNIKFFKEKGFDYIIFDTSPSVSKLTISVLYVCDGVFIPIQMSEFSNDGLQEVVGTIRQTNSKNKTNTTIYGLIPNEVMGTSPKELLELGSLNTYMPGKILPFLSHRRPFKTTMNGYTPIWDLKKQAGNVKDAVHEMKKLMAGIDSKLNLEVNVDVA